jgi:excisionase family DNA binding protein
MRARQQLLRTLIADIVVDVDDAVRDVVLTIHWRGGQHSDLRVRKPRAGEHGCATDEDALAVMRSMAGRWSDEHIAASLNRMGLPTGQGKTWTAHRVYSVRRVRGIHAYRSAEKNGEWLTMTEAAKALGTTSHTIRRLIKTGMLPAVQVVPRAPHQIRADDLMSEPIKAAMARKGRPCRTVDANTLPMFTDT